MIERLLKAAEVAELLGVSKTWVYAHCTAKNPKIPHIKFGGQLRFERAAIADFVNLFKKVYG